MLEAQRSNTMNDAIITGFCIIAAHSCWNLVLADDVKGQNLVECMHNHGNVFPATILFRCHCTVTLCLSHGGPAEHFVVLIEVWLIQLNCVEGLWSVYALPFQNFGINDMMPSAWRIACHEGNV